VATQRAVAARAAGIQGDAAERCHFGSRHRWPAVYGIAGPLSGARHEATLDAYSESATRSDFTGRNTAGMKAPLVTVAIPTYNRVGTLQRAVESARRQDYSNLGILICDNASQDETETYCRSVAAKDPRIAIVRHPQNLGPSENFKAGLRLAQGEFFMWLADDDWVDDNYVSECASALLAEPTAVLASGRIKYFDGDRSLHSEEPLQLLAEGPEQRIVDYLWKVGDNGAFHGVYRHPWVREIQIASRFGEDWHFMAQALIAGRVIGAPKAAIHRARGGASEDIGILAKRLGVPTFLGEKPHAIVAWNLVRQIMAGEGLYSRIDSLRRPAFALRVAAIVLGRFCAPKWYARNVPRVGGLRRFIRPTS
jgi:glycosyltransferase involved in cell wall biosynthesis